MPALLRVLLSSGAVLRGSVQPVKRILSALQRTASRLPRPVRRLINSIWGVGRLRTWLAGKPRLAGPQPGELRPVVYLPTWAQWDVMRQRPQYVLAAFAAAGHPVYFVDHREPVARTADGVRIVPRISEVPTRDVILYVHFAPLRELFDSFERPAIVYDILDDLTIYEADETHLPADRRVAAHHDATLRRADVVLTSSPQLATTHRAEAPDLLMVENGVDTAKFSAPAEVPTDLPTGNGPLVGYVGAVSYWFDFQLLAEVAKGLPDWRFCLVGPVDPRAEDEARQLDGIDNIFLLGERPSDVVPGYIQAFDVGTVWFRINELTRAVSPLKLYEYLAAGVPCVSTPVPVAVASPAVRTAATSTEFVEQIRLAVEERDRPDFLAAAAEEVAEAEWLNRIQPILRRLEELDLRKAPTAT